MLYEDGSRSSNRKVPSSQLGGLDEDTIVISYIEAQDRKIAEVSGKPRADQVGIALAGLIKRGLRDRCRNSARSRKSTATPERVIYACRSLCTRQQR